VKGGLLHTSNLTTLTIHKFKLANATDLKFGQHEALTQMNNWRKFQFHMSFDSQVMVFQVYRFSMCVEDAFS